MNLSLTEKKWYCTTLEYVLFSFCYYCLFVPRTFLVWFYLCYFSSVFFLFYFFFPLLKSRYSCPYPSVPRTLLACTCTQLHVRGGLFGSSGQLEYCHSSSSTLLPGVVMACCFAEPERYIVVVMQSDNVLSACGTS